MYATSSPIISVNVIVLHCHNAMTFRKWNYGKKLFLAAEKVCCMMSLLCNCYYAMIDSGTLQLNTLIIHGDITFDWSPLI